MRRRAGWYAAACLLAPAAPALAQQPWMPEGLAAVTFCRAGRPETWIAAAAAGGPHREALLAHEAVHRAQAVAYTTCEGFYRSITSPQRLVEIEIPAYCAQLAVEISIGAPQEALLREMARALARDAGVAESTEQVLRTMKDQCHPAEPAVSQAALGPDALAAPGP